MIPPKELKKYKERGISQEILDFTDKFLEDNDSTLFNLAILDSSEMRIMFTSNKTGKTEAKIFPIPK